MNKIYRLVWNHGLQAMVVASEIARADGPRPACLAGRAAAPRLAVMASAVLLVLAGTAWLGTGAAMAQDAVCVDPVTGAPVGDPSGSGSEVACGNGAVASGNDSVAIGRDARAESLNAIAMGTNAISGRQDATYAGAAASVPTNTIAIGPNAQASAGSSIALGDGARTFQGIGSATLPTNYGIAIGTRATAIGNNLVIGNFSPAGSGSPGYNAGQGTNPQNINNITIGNGAGANVGGRETVIIGFEAGTNAIGSGGSVFIGRTAGQNSANQNNIGVGADASRRVEVGGNTAMGASAGNDVRRITPDVYDPTTPYGSALAAAGVLPAGAAITDFHSRLPNGEVNPRCSWTFYCADQPGNGINNIGIGPDAGSSVFGGMNTGIGFRSGKFTVGFNNIALGPLAGYRTYGSYNIGISVSAGEGTKGWFNTAIGNGSGMNVVGDQNTFIGSGAGQNVTGSNNLGIGQSAGQRVAGSGNYASGQAAGSDTTGNRNFAAGNNAGRNVTGNNNSAVGQGAGQGVTGNFNFATGHQAGMTVRGDYNYAQGYQAGQAVVGNNNTAIGQAAGQSVQGERNTAVGINAGKAVAGNDNDAYGTNAGIGVSGSFNYAAGQNAGQYVSGLSNIAIGRDAGNGAAGDPLAASRTIAIGVQSHVHGDVGIAIGTMSEAGQAGVTGLSRAVALGAAARAQGVDAIAQGTAALASGVSSVAIGSGVATPTLNPDGTVASYTIDEAGATASGDRAIAIGKGAVASGIQSISIGTGNEVSGNNSGALGDPTYISGDNSYGIGNNNTIEADRAFVLGNEVTIPVGMDGAVVLGDASTADAAVPTASGTVGGITYGTFAGATPAPGQIVSVGAVGAERQIKNVAAGQISPTSTDAINGSQLFATQSTIGNLAQSVADGMGGTSVVNPDGSVTTVLNVGGAVYNDVNSALNQVNTVANAGWNASATGAGSTTANIGPNGNVTFAGDSNVTVTQTGADDAGLVNVTLNPDLAVNSVTTGNTVMDTTGVTVNGGANGPVQLTGSGLDNGGNTIVNVAAGVNPTDAVNVSQLTQAQAAATTSVATATPDQLSVTATANADGSTTYNVGAVTTTLGNAADGSVNAPASATALATAGDIADAINNAGFTLTAQGANGSLVNPGSTVDMRNTDGNIVIGKSTADNNVVYNLNPDVQLDSLTINNGGPVINSGGITMNAGNTLNMGGNQITNVAPGVAGTDAVNVDQLNQVGNDLVAQGLDFAGNVGANVHRDLGQTLAIVGEATTAGTYSGANVRTVTDPATGAINVQIADSPQFGNVVVNVDGSGRITGVSPGAVGATSTDAINGSQLFALGNSTAVAIGGGSSFDPVTGQVIAQLAVGGNTYNNVQDALTAVGGVASAGWNLTAQGANASNVAPGETVDLRNTDGNIVVGKDASDDTVNFDLADDISVNSVTLGGGTVILGSTGLVIAGGPSVTTSGIDAGNLAITNVAPGVAGTDAVNVDQLNQVGNDLVAQGLDFSGNVGANVHRDLGQTLAIVGEATTAGTYSGANVRTVTDPATGAINVQIADSPQFGNVVVNVDGSGRITGVSPGAVGATSTDAINGSQLFALGNSTAVAIGGGSSFDPVTGQVIAQLVVGGTTYNSVQDALVTVNNNVGGGWYLQANGGPAYNVAPNTTLDVVDGSNTRVVHEGNQLRVDVVDNPTFTGMVTADGGLTVGAGQTVDMGGNVVRNVAAGEVSATSTDAVNGSQLHATNQRIDVIDGRVTNLETTVGGIAGDVTDLETGAAGMFQVSQDHTTAPSPTGANSAAGGASAVASGDNSTALGNDTRASGAASTAVGQGAQATGSSSVAIGAGSVALEDNVVSVGRVGGERRITNVAAGVNPTDAVNVSQLRQQAAGGVQYDRNADGSVDYTSVTLNPGGTAPTTIRNVAAGVAPTDAVNVGQLQSGLSDTLNQANTYTDQRFNQVGQDVWEMRRGYRGGTASAMAMAGLPQAYLPGKSMLAVGMGGFQGEYGMAVGLSGITDNGRWVYKAQATGNTTREWGFSVGAGIQW